MLGDMLQKKETRTEEQIKKERQKWLDEMIGRSARLKRLSYDKQSGWVEFVELLDDYIDKCKKRKAITALDRASDDTIYQLKLIDHEVFILNFVKQIPAQFMRNVEKALEKERKKENAPD